MLVKDPLGNMIDIDQKMGTKYTLRDLTITNTGILNVPIAGSQEFENLKIAAITLEDLENSIGPFNIISVYRSPEVQNAILNHDPMIPRPKSFHEAGMAWDIYPTTMSIQEFFGRILASDWLNNLGEISLKPKHNTLHISNPTLRTRGKVSVMDDNHVYVKQSSTQIAQYATPYTQNEIAFEDDVWDMFGGITETASDWFGFNDDDFELDYSLGVDDFSQEFRAGFFSTKTMLISGGVLVLISTIILMTKYR